MSDSSSKLSRRELIKVGALGTAGLAIGGGALKLQSQDVLSPSQARPPAGHGHGAHDDMNAVGELRPGGFNPTSFLTHFDYGRTSTLPGGPQGRSGRLAQRCGGLGPDLR